MQKSSWKKYNAIHELYAGNEHHRDNRNTTSMKVNFMVFLVSKNNELPLNYNKPVKIGR
jgi:hypothetical protein